MARSEDVDVVEAIPSSDGDINDHVADDREDNNPKNDQMVSESGDGPPPKNHAYTAERRASPPNHNHNNRGDTNHMGLTPPHPGGKNYGPGKQPVFDRRHSYNGPPPPLPPKQQVCLLL